MRRSSRSSLLQPLLLPSSVWPERPQQRVEGRALGTSGSTRCVATRRGGIAAAAAGDDVGSALAATNKRKQQGNAKQRGKYVFDLKFPPPAPARAAAPPRRRRIVLVPLRRAPAASLSRTGAVARRRCCFS